jgi:hypothetical protein
MQAKSVDMSILPNPADGHESHHTVRLAIHERVAINLTLDRAIGI